METSQNRPRRRNLKGDWLLNQGGDPVQTSKSTMNHFKKHKLKLWERSSKCPDLNIAEKLWVDLKHVVCAEENGWKFLHLE